MQDAVCERAVDVGQLLKGANTCVSTCEPRGMENGALQEIANIHGRDTDEREARLERGGHSEVGYFAGPRQFLARSFETR